MYSFGKEFFILLYFIYFIVFWICYIKIDTGYPVYVALDWTKISSYILFVIIIFMLFGKYVISIYLSNLKKKKTNYIDY